MNFDPLRYYQSFILKETMKQTTDSEKIQLIGDTLIQLLTLVQQMEKRLKALEEKELKQ